jgi:hypothetical protein
MKQLKVGLTDDVRDELERAAKAHGLSTSEEARLRIETSLGLDYYDPAVMEFAEHILGLADSISRFENSGTRPVAGWHKKPAFFEALKIAIETWLGLIAPPAGEGSPGDIDPSTLGRSVALSQHRYLLEKLKVDRELHQLRHSLQDKPIFHYSGYYGKGSMTLRELDEAQKKMSEKDRLEIREEAERNLKAEYRREHGQRTPQEVIKGDRKP